MRHNIKKEESVFAKIDSINHKLAKKDEQPAAATKGKPWKKGGGGLLNSFTAAATTGPARQAYNSATTLDMEALNAQWRDQLMEAYSWVTHVNLHLNLKLTFTFILTLILTLPLIDGAVFMGDHSNLHPSPNTFVLLTSLPLTLTISYLLMVLPYLT